MRKNKPAFDTLRLKQQIAQLKFNESNNIVEKCNNHKIVYVLSDGILWECCGNCGYTKPIPPSPQ